MEKQSQCDCDNVLVSTVTFPRLLRAGVVGKLFTETEAVYALLFRL